MSRFVTHKPRQDAPSHETNARRRSDAVKEEAAQLGFDVCGIAAVSEWETPTALDVWLGRGFHAEMDWMAASSDVRRDVRLKLPQAKSVIVTARNYYAPRPKARGRRTGRVSRYAWGRDYHRVLRGPMKKLTQFVERLEEEARCYWTVDVGPVLERTWAARAGVGWIGKNGLVLRRDLGSWLFLGAILTTVELAADAPMKDYCGSCSRCIDACPTRAIVEPGVVDARRCIAYHTVENRGAIPDDLAPAFEDWVFGCDVCQEVCPWNRFAKETSEEGFLPLQGHANPALAVLVEMSDAAFHHAFAGTPIRRAKAEGIRRNARVASCNRLRRGE